MTWLELYEFLHKKANNSNEIGTVDWNQRVMVHDSETGEENGCDVWEVTNEDSGQKRLVAAVNDQYFGG